MKWAASIFLSLLGISAIAQSNIEIQGEYARGFILEHSPSISHLTRSHPTSFWISAYKYTDGRKEWESRYNYPKIGATLFIMDYQNPVLGKSIGLIPNYSFYLGDPLGSINGYFKIGIGPSYHTNPYDKVENNKNNVISTTFTYGTFLQSGATIKLSKQLIFNTGLSFTHFSNGSFKKPNAGINIISWNSGITYNLNNNPVEYRTTAKEDSLNTKWQPFVQVSGGLSETVKIRSGTYPFINIQLLMDKRLSYKSRIALGLEYFHSLSLKEEIKNDIWLTEDEDPDFRRAAVIIGHDLIINKISVVKQLGYYIYDPYQAFQPFFMRIGLRYELSEDLSFGLTLKSHYFKAEATEWNIGYRF
ncbi:MAG: acyloxyacyl hydrolase [Candidatus Cyclobacteriaceae bacterium M2_1C_046]